MSSSTRKTETASHQEFQGSLRLLDVAASWELWDGILRILLLPVTIAAFSIPGLGLYGRASLGVLWIVSGLTLYHQRSRLKMLRAGLVEQMDGATKNHARAEKLYGLSILDPLTGLYNRRFGQTRLDEEIARAGEVSDPLLLLAIDFDRFKEINDRLGHAAGDLALMTFSRRLQRAIRACDVPIRLGGDEFLVILPECPPDKVPLIMSRMGKITFPLDGRQIPVSFSYGLAQHQFNDTPETMVKRADERLYAAKAQRKTAAAELPAATETIRIESGAEASSHDHAYSGAISLAEAEGAPVRLSVRQPKRIDILLIGNDLGGASFVEPTGTVDLSRHGISLVSRHKLDLEQEVVVRSPETNRETEAKVVRVISSHSDSHTYGLAFVGATIEIFGVEIPALLGESEDEEHATTCHGSATHKNRLSR